MGSDAPTIVPANRLGQLLTEARQRGGTDLEELATTSAFTVGELADFEAGHRVLNDEIVASITSLYALDCGPIIPQRAELTIDLNQNLLTASGHALPLDSAAHQHVLDRYLSLLYVLRDRAPGSSVPLRGEDLDILAASLAERRELIEEQLLASMLVENDVVPGLVGWFKSRLWVPTAGAIVSAVSVGTLIMVSGTAEAPAESTEEPEPEPEPLRGLTAAGAAIITVPTDSTTTTPTTTPPPSTGEATGPVIGSRTSVPSTVANPAPAGSTSLPAPPATDAPAEVAFANTPQAIGAQAEALLPFDWQETLPGWEINYLGPDDRFRGLTYPYEKSIDMFVRDNDTPESLAGILAHELAHAIDVEHFGDGERNEWRQARNIDDAPWWPDAYASDFETGAGDFAESFAYWALGDESSSRIGGNPNAEQLVLIQSFVNGI